MPKTKKSSEVGNSKQAKVRDLKPKKDVKAGATDILITKTIDKTSPR
jgi:hypothetical protein